MKQDPLTTAQGSIRELTTRKVRPLQPLEAVFQVSESLSGEDAKEALQRLLAQRYLPCDDADLAQMLAAKLGVTVQWSHMPLEPGGEWAEGRGQ